MDFFPDILYKIYIKLIFFSCYFTSLLILIQVLNMTTIDERVKMIMEAQISCEIFMKEVVVPALKGAAFNVTHEDPCHCCRVYFGKTLHHQEFGPYDGISISTPADVNRDPNEPKTTEGLLLLNDQLLPGGYSMQYWSSIIEIINGVTQFRDGTTA